MFYAWSALYPNQKMITTSSPNDNDFIIQR